MSAPIRGLWAAVVVWIGVASSAAAQGASVPPKEGPTPPAWTREISGGVVFNNGFDLGSRDAVLTPNSGSSGFELFTTSSRMRSVVGVQARLGVYVTPTIAIEGGVRFARPVFEVSIGGDFEDAEDTTVEETLSQYLFDASVVVHFRGLIFARGRAIPFVSGGAGYLRELHEGNELVEEGIEYHAGGGVKWWFGSGRRFGFRGEGGISIRNGGFDLEDGPRVVPVAGASLMWMF